MLDRILAHFRVYFNGIFLSLFYPFWSIYFPHKRRQYYLLVTSNWTSVSERPLEVLVSDSLDDATTVQLKALVTKVHNCTVLELFALAVITKSMRARNVYEIGTYDGRSTLAFACNVTADGKVNTLNLPVNFINQNPEQESNPDSRLSAEVESGSRFLSQPEKERIEQWWGDSKEFSADANAPYDLIFIDGNHSYEYVRRDTTEALRLINKDNVIITWHDATRYGVGQWLSEFAKEHNVYRISGTDIAFMRFVNGHNISF